MLGTGRVFAGTAGGAHLKDLGRNSPPAMVFRFLWIHDEVD